MSYLIANSSSEPEACLWLLWARTLGLWADLESFLGLAEAATVVDKLIFSLKRRTCTRTKPDLDDQSHTADENRKYNRRFSA